MKFSGRVLALLVCISLAAYGQGNTFDRVRYNGGSVDSKVNPKEWHNTLVVTSDYIRLSLKDGKSVDIPAMPKDLQNYAKTARVIMGQVLFSDSWLEI